MIHIGFDLSNPWSDRWNILWSRSGLFSSNKAWEFNGYQTNRIVELEFSLRLKGDHAGFRIMLGLLGYEAELHFYDTRHWDHDTNTWETYD